MVNSRLRRLLVGTALAVVAIGALPAATAAAAPTATAMSNTTHATITVGQRHSAARSIQPDTGCPIRQGNFTVYSNSCSSYQDYGCIRGDQGNMVYPATYVSNGCSWRVWIYTGADKTGTALCITKLTQTGVLQRDYVWFWISSNGSTC